MGVRPPAETDRAGVSGLGRSLAIGVIIGAAVVASVLTLRSIAPAQPHAAPAIEALTTVQSADFGTAPASADVRRVAEWIANSGDNAGLSFFIVDKKQALLYRFDAPARLIATAPVLLGSAPGDDTVPGIGLRPIADVRPDERTTPAGRFVGERGHNTSGKDVVWVDYDAAVSMHRVIDTQPHERRLQRLASAAVADRRISYGCINVPVAFYEDHVRPAFATHRAMIYVLPEHKSLEEVFGADLEPEGRAAQAWRTPAQPAAPGPSVRIPAPS